MKPAFLSLPFLLFALTTTLPLALAAEQVVDTNGKHIFPNGSFYIMPASSGAAGGGLKLGITGNSNCPLAVLQDYSQVIKGLPVKFTIKQEYYGPGMIFTGTPLDIEFVHKLQCVGSTKWVVVVDDFPKPWVAIGGAQDHPGKQVFDGSFKIHKYGRGYKLVFCPNFITVPLGLCYDIGRYDDKPGKRLILTRNNPYEVVFEEADANGPSTP